MELVSDRTKARVASKGIYSLRLKARVASMGTEPESRLTLIRG